MIINSFAERIYYIDSSNGSDTNDGLSPKTAWKTVNKVNQSWSIIDTGDDILFKRGEIFNDATLNIEKGGTESDSLVIGAYGSGEKPILSHASGGIKCLKPNLGYITVKDISFQDITKSHAVLFQADNLSHITISNCDIDNVNDNGIYWSESSFRK